MIIIAYVDDCIIASDLMKDANTFVNLRNLVMANGKFSSMFDINQLLLGSFLWLSLNILFTWKTNYLLVPYYHCFVSINHLIGVHKHHKIFCTIYTTVM
jgi:hypothetical protein